MGKAIKESESLSKAGNPETRKRRAEEVFLVGHFGGRNCGDEAMLLGFLDRFLARTSSNCKVVAKEPAALRAALDEALTESERKRVAVTPMETGRFLKALHGAGGLILVGGTHFHDDYPRLRLARHARYMARYAAAFALARARGLPTAALAMGAGPFRRRWSRLLLWVFARTACLVTLRDRASAELFRTIAGREAEVTFDWAVFCARRSGTRRPDPEGFSVGVSVTRPGAAWLEQGASPAAFVASLAKALIEALRRRPEATIRVLPIREGTRESDEPLCRALAGAVEAAVPGRVALAQDCSRPLRALEEIARSRLFLAMRYHSALLAYALERPLAIFPYHEKLRMLAREIDLPKEAVIEPKEALQSDQLARRLSAALENPDRFRARLSVEEAERRAERNLDAWLELWKSFSGRRRA